MLAMDAEIRLLREGRAPQIVGGVFRQLLTEGDRLRLAIVVYEGSDVSSATVQESLGANVTVVAVNHSGDPRELLRRIVRGVLRRDIDSSDLESTVGQLLWTVPPVLKQHPIEGTFLAESICDVFDSPSVVPVA